MFFLKTLTLEAGIWCRNTRQWW